MAPLLALVLPLLSLRVAASVEVRVDSGSRHLLVDGQRFFARGVTYSPVPVGERLGDWLGAGGLERSIWARDLELMAAMGVNSLRVSGLVPSEDHGPFFDACWAKGILVAITLEWPASLSLADAAGKVAWTQQVLRHVRRYRSHPAVLLWGIGDGSDRGSDTDAGRKQRLAFVADVREAIHREEQQTGHWHPVCAESADRHLSEYLALEADRPAAIDLWCLRLRSGAGFLESLAASNSSKLPFMITEYGADAWDGANQREWSVGPLDEQRDALLSMSKTLRDWRSAVAGGMVLSFVDEWWKCSSGGPSEHDPCSAGSADGLPDKEANEEWWGLYATAPGPIPQARTPRAAVPSLTRLWHEVSFTASFRLAPEADTYVGKWEASSKHGRLEHISTKYHSWTVGSGTEGQSKWNEVGLLRFPAVRAPSCEGPRARVEVSVRWLTTEPLVLAYGPLADLAWAEPEVSWSDLTLKQLTRRTVTLMKADINQRVALDMDGWWSLGQPVGVWLQPDDTIAENNDQQAGFYSRESSFGAPELSVTCGHSWADEGWYGFAGTMPPTTTHSTTAAAQTSLPVGSTSTMHEAQTVNTPTTSGIVASTSPRGATTSAGSGASVSSTTSISSATVTTPSLSSVTTTSTLRTVGVAVDRSARRILVDGQPFFAQGVCYSPVPVGEPAADWLGASALERSIWGRDLELMAAMGVNALQVSNLSLAKDHAPFLDACRGAGIMVTVALDWPASWSLADSASRAQWTSEVVRLVNRYKGHPAVLVWSVGSETSRVSGTDTARRQHLSFVSEVREAIHQEEVRTGHWHPVCTALTDLRASEYFALEADHPSAVDLWCLQLRGSASFRSSLFETYPSRLPLLITEYGVDAWDAAAGREWSAAPRDEQRDALISESRELRDWRSVVSGGMVLGFVDEWWRCASGSPSEHDGRCSAGGARGLSDDEVNEEWWGLYATAPGPSPQRRTPRAAVSALTSLWHEASFSSTTRSAAEADTYVGKWEATSEHGHLDRFSIKYHSWTPGSGTIGQSEWNEVGLLRFPALSPSSCEGPRAKVDVFLRWLSVESMVIAYGPLSDLAWDEAAVSWADLTLERRTRRTVTLTKANVSKRVTLDADGWWSPGRPLGLWLQPDDTVAANSDEQAGFYSRESSFGPPELAVTCSHSWALEGWYRFAGTTSTTSATPTATTVITTTTTALVGTSSASPANETAGGASTTQMVGAVDMPGNNDGIIGPGNASNASTSYTVTTTTTATDTATVSSTTTVSSTATTTTTLRMNGVAVDRSTRRLLVDGKRFFAQGVCYSPVPVGQPPVDWLGPTPLERSIWERDLELMAAMGVNALRVYDISLAKDHAAFFAACKAKGIMVTITLDWPSSLSLTDTDGKAHWTWEVLQHVRKYKSHPAVLAWGIGNEKNHASDTDADRRQHLAFVSSVREAIHLEEQQSGDWHPVCTTLMDLHLNEYFALEADYPTAVDLWCLQLYRGDSFRSSLFATYPSRLPLLITEYGADAWDGANQREWSVGLRDEQRDAMLAKSRELRDWRSVVAGGMIFAFVDEWWKCGSGLDDVHDVCSVGGFGGLSDKEANEEWWGLYATAPGPYPQVRTPRPVVAALAQLWHEINFQATTRLMPDADTYIGKWEATSKHGHLDYISTKYHSWTPGSGPEGQSEWNEVGLLRFPAVPPSSCDGPSATVEVFVRWLSVEPMVLAYGPLSDVSWPESPLNWKNLTLRQRTRRSVTLMKADIFKKVTLDVDGWWALGRPFALWLQPDDTVAANSDEQAGFYSHESHFGPPELAVTCSHSWVDEGWYGFATTTSTTTTVTWTNATDDGPSATNTSTTASTTSRGTSTTSSATTSSATTTALAGDEGGGPSASPSTTFRSRSPTTTSGSAFRGTTTSPVAPQPPSTTEPCCWYCWWCK